LTPELIMESMPLLNGLEATGQVLKTVPSTKIIILSGHNDDAYVKNATASGAVGFLLKQATAHNICRAIREVNRGQAVFGPFNAKFFLEVEQKSLDRSVRTNPAQFPADFARDGSATTYRRRQCQQANCGGIGRRYEVRRKTSRASHGEAKYLLDTKRKR